MGLLIVLSILWTIPIKAQIVLGTGTVSGIIRDSSGAAVSDAKVTLAEQSKGWTRRTESNNGGRFLFLSLIAGVYTLRVEKQGFTPGKMENLRVDLGTYARVEMILNLGELRASVTVTPPTAAELNAESNAIGSMVSSGQVQMLPLNGRNFLQLALLTAGANEVNSASNVFSSNVGPPGRVVVLPGTLPHLVSYSLNGISVKSSRDGELALSPSVAAVDQFRVQTTFLMPDQGTGPGVVNIVTKSGTNKLHGEVFEFFRNNNLDARSFFAPGPEDLKRNQFGFAVGGPLQKDRLWFHGFYEGLREITAFSASGYAPTPAMFDGNFAETGKVIYDPASFRTDSGTRQPFASFSIPVDRFNPVARNLLDYYRPGDSFGSRPNNITTNPRKTLDDNQFGFRLDGVQSQRAQWFVQIFQQNTPSVQPGLFPLSGLSYANEAQVAMFQHTWSLSYRSINSLRLGFVRNVAIGGNEARELGPVLRQVGVANTFDANGVTAINLQGYSSFGQAIGELGNRDNTWQIEDVFAYTAGAHNLAFGAGVRYRRGWHLNGNGAALGMLSFQPAFTAQLAIDSQDRLTLLANTGDSFADFLMGIPVTGFSTGLPAVQFRGTQFTPFIQDSWKLTRNFTLNYGLSWFLETPPDPQQEWARNAVHGFDSRTGLLVYAGLGQISPKAVSMDRNNLAPRLGFAWKPGRLPAMVIRAGAGVFYSEFPYVLAAYPITSGSPVGLGKTLTNPPTAPEPAFVLGRNVFPEAPAAPLSPTFAESLPAGTVATALNPAFRITYVSQWNLSIQHSFGRSDSIELSYLGSSGHRLPNPRDLSQCRPTSDLLCDPATRPWPRYGLVLYGDSAGNSSHGALVTKYEHRADLGLDLTFEYAYAKALADTWQSALSIYNQISNCRSCSKGPASFDVRHRAVTSLIWQIPFRIPSSRERRWLNRVVEGWTVAGIVALSSGLPVVLKGPARTGSALINHLPNRVCDGRSSEFSNNIRENGFLLFDTACFPVPPVGYFGNSGPTVINAPGRNNWDLSVEKSFRLPGPPAFLHFRLEMFNAFNKAQFQPPNGDSGAGANFGRISGTHPPRLLQLATKVSW